MRLLLALLLLALAAGRPAALTAADAAQAYYRGEWEACLQAYREALKQDPWDVGARRSLVRVLRQYGEARQALGHLELLLLLRPGDSGLRLEAAETALLAGEPELALRRLLPEVPTADSLYLEALALLELGRGEQAASALEGSLEAQDFRPQGWYQLGLLRFQQGDVTGAEEALRKALAQEPNLSTALLPLARVHLAQGQVPRAYALLRRADAVLAGDPEVQDLLRQLTDEHPSLTEELVQERRTRREAAVPRRAEAFPEGAARLPRLRIGLLEKARELTLKTGGRFALTVLGDGGETLSGEPGQLLSIRQEEAEVTVAGPQGEPLLRSPHPLRLEYEDPADTTLLFDVEFGQGAFWAGSEDRMYRGWIELLPRPEGLTAVNVLGLEEYLYSVLPSEMPSSWPAAALQAQAVAARSYTLANLGRFAARGFDLLGSVASAAYRGLGAETPQVRAAVDATRGLVLMDGDKPLSAFYSANSGGCTDTTETAWGFPSSLPAAVDPQLEGSAFPLPPEELALWLAARPSTYSSHPDYHARSAYRWQLWVPREEIERRLDSADSLGSVRAVVPGARGVSGRVREVLVVGTAGEAALRYDAIRGRLGGLRSNLFTVEPVPGPGGLPRWFLFTGAGWGHGVGLCQSGAAGMAASGFSAEQILRHYYGEVPLRRLD